MGWVHALKVIRNIKTQTVIFKLQANYIHVQSSRRTCRIISRIATWTIFCIFQTFDIKHQNDQQSNSN